ncbi:MAG TPA: FecR domain-containing protein [Gemmatimonadaceae bacterium]|nr:FecR domain-containing protein [Gemmatimonadaceae bacterium]
MPEIIDWERIARYVARESSPAERAEVERWLADDPTRQALLDDIKRRWAAADVPVVVDVDRAWNRVAARMKSPSSHTISDDVVLGDEVPERRAIPFRRYALPLAAGLVLVAGVAYWLSNSEAERTALAVAGGEYVVPRGGAQRTVTLGDSTEVILASASRLVVAPDYGRGSRTVDLEGEALFRVRHDSARPFRVRLGSVTAEDLGTEFVVRHLASSEQPVRIAVREGIVGIKGSGWQDTLRARDIVIANGTELIVRRDQDLDPYFAWTRGQLVFDNTPLSDVAAELSRWFDVDVTVDSSVANRPFSSPILTTTPIDEVLQIVGSATDVRVERQGRVVRFTRPGYTGELPVRAGPSREVAG